MPPGHSRWGARQLARACTLDSLCEGSPGRLASSSPMSEYRFVLFYPQEMDSFSFSMLIFVG